MSVLSWNLFVASVSLLKGQNGSLQRCLRFSQKLNNRNFTRISGKRPTKKFKKNCQFLYRMSSGRVLSVNPEKISGKIWLFLSDTVGTSQKTAIALCFGKKFRSISRQGIFGDNCDYVHYNPRKAVEEVFNGVIELRCLVWKRSAWDRAWILQNYATKMFLSWPIFMLIMKKH